MITDSLKVTVAPVMNGLPAGKSTGQWPQQIKRAALCFGGASLTQISGGNNAMSCSLLKPLWSHITPTLHPPPSPLLMAHHLALITLLCVLHFRSFPFSFIYLFLHVGPAKECETICC